MEYWSDVETQYSTTPALQLFLSEYVPAIGGKLDDGLFTDG
jgi:hypothetical protein